MDVMCWGDGKVFYGIRDVCVDVGVLGLGYSCVGVGLWISERLVWICVFG